MKKHYQVMKQGYYMLLTTLLFYPAVAQAKLSDWFRSMKAETGAAYDFFKIAFIVVGFLVTGAALVSAIQIKRQNSNQPLDWQGWALLGGPILAILGVLMTAITGSASGTEAEASRALQELDASFNL